MGKDFSLLGLEHLSDFPCFCAFYLSIFQVSGSCLSSGYFNMKDNSTFTSQGSFFILDLTLHLFALGNFGNLLKGAEQKENETYVNKYFKYFVVRNYYTKEVFFPPPSEKYEFLRSGDLGAVLDQQLFITGKAQSILNPSSIPITPSIRSDERHDHNQWSQSLSS